jgi:ABC-type lipoprotein export system ATPase subunit
VPIVCRDVVKRYVSAAGSVEALHAIDGSFPAAGLTALVGPSGSGKSTLLRLLAGLDGADSGTIETGDIDVTALHGRALRAYRRDTVTYAAQRAADNLVPHLTVREHLGSRTDVTLLAELGLEARLDARAAQLSGGEQARAALGIALLRDTPVLLADEPTAELDRAAAAHVLDALLRVAAAGRTVVVATHDADLVARADVTLALGSPGDRQRPYDHAVAAAQPGAPHLEVRGLTKSYRGTHAVSDVSFELGTGEVGVLLGRSGSGKSTLLMMLGGWLPPDGGTIVVAGRVQDGAPPWRATSYLAQRFGLLPELSIGENVALPLRLSAQPGGGPDGDGVATLLQRLGLAELADRPPAETSVGQQQRAALARALVQSPTLLLADEPTSHQDAAFAERVWDVLGAARAAGTACLVATHDPAVAARADRVWQIADGRLGRLEALTPPRA